MQDRQLPEKILRVRVCISFIVNYLRDYLTRRIKVSNTMQSRYLESIRVPFPLPVPNPGHLQRVQNLQV